MITQSNITKMQSWPIFIVGSYRSGSTLLRYLLDAHENLACPPESKFILPLTELPTYPEVALALHGMGFTRDDILKKIGEFVASIFSEFAHRERKSRWVDKTPNYYRHIRFIDEIFADRVMYICITRHPLDCIASLEEFFSPVYHHQDRDIVEHIRRYGRDRRAWALLWLEIYDSIYNSAQSRLDRFHFIRYEDLVLRTESTLRAALQFLGESYTSGLADTAFNKFYRMGLGDPKLAHVRGVHDQSVGRWQSFPKDEARLLWEIVSNVANRYGYSSPFTSDEVGKLV